MHPSLRLAAAASPRAHKPLIRFLGKRVWPTIPEPPHPHPAAPAEFKESFSSFLAKFQASTMHPPTSVAKPQSGVQSGAQVIEEFWDMPQRLRSPAMTEAEMEAITSGGASLH